MTSQHIPRLLLPAFVMLLGSAGCGHTPVPSTPPVPVVTAAVEVAGADSVPATRYSGTARPHSQVMLSFRVGGYVQSILQVRDATGETRTVQAGDTVTAGTVLARLGTADYRAPVAAAADAAAAARANVSQAGFQRNAARASRQQALDAVTEAHTALAAAAAQRAEAVAGIGQADAAVTGAQADAALARDTDLRTETLFQSGSATLPQQQEARANDSAASARLMAARQSRDAARGHLAEADAQIAACKARIAEAQASALAATAAVSRAGSAVTAARAQAAQAQATQASQAVPLAETTLRAPMTGIVLSRPIEIGELVGPTLPAFSLADTTRLDVAFGVPEAAVRRLHIGQHVVLTLGDGDEITLPGTVTEIAPAANAETGVFDVQITARNPAGSGKIGMVATLALPGDRGGRDALTVPVSAIVQSRDHPGGFAVVLVLAGQGHDTARYRDVEVGPTYGDRIVVHGLGTGNRVAASAPSQLYDGEVVQGTAPGADGGDDGSL